VRNVHAPRTQLGLTLIELMISVAIGLVVVGAVTYLYVGSRGAYRGNEALARIQDAGRFALDSIARDVRRAGALGCGSVASVAGQGPVNVNMIATGLAVDASGQPIPITGFIPASYSSLPATAPTGWTAPAGAPYWGGDVLQLQIGSGVPVRVTALDTAGGTITVASNTAPAGSAPNFNAPNYAVLGNCSAAAVFQVSGTPTSGASAVLAYAPASAVVPLATSGQFSLAADTYPTLQHFDQVTYYVGKVPNSASTAAFPNGLSALYRYSLSGGGAPEELVESVEDMDVTFGVDTTPNDNVVSADVYEKADAVTAANAWPNVVSVRVSLIAVGDQLGAAPAPQTLTLHGTTAWTAPDTRLRQIFTATAALRDRLQ
jgi:type IV pilus assembly protein PilW